MPEFAQAQISQQGRSQTRQQADPGRFEQRFEAPSKPRSTVVPVQPDNLKPAEPEELKKIRFFLNKIIISGATVYSEKQFAYLSRNFLRREVSLAHVYRMAAAITARYRNDGYILSKAVVPPQEIVDGVIRLRIIEGYIDEINVKGDVQGPKKLINAFRKKLLSSRPLHSSDLERYLLLADDLPGVTVKSVITPSRDRPGASRLDLILENKSYDAQVSLDNRGTDFNGPVQFSMGLTANSPLKMYDRIGLQSVITSQTDELKFISGFYDTPLNGEGTRFQISGSYANSQPGDTLELFEVDGTSTSLGFRVTHPFIRSRGENLTAFAGLNVKSSETDILETADSEDRLRVFELGASYDYADSFRGVNLFSISLSKGLNIFNATESGFERLTREAGRSDFTKLSGQMMRLQEIAPSWMLQGSFAWQYAFNPLLASEEFGFGGSRFGRAYDSSEITGDTGLAFKVEFQKAIGVNKPWLQDLQAYTFFDYGTVWTRARTVNGEKRQDRYSAGIGTRFNLNSYISGYVEMNKPLDEVVSSTGDDDPRFFFGLTARY
ncbi:MAG: ShlB/FhaC/HecB family hemolysin secretion/activation protein [Candidatus Nitrohelix vancouverensis]|uniref:ShlB/FhaC/HecB family hemolysin secretion/activation protein n=1 Tax=Candidatus Nitrohelix vancouverensis TaxID=2705534 RepID=A0A7T0C1S1_9BACT|nr:MAG: ShlB/FhaC/HecB family hemolysin secretion/activation protein [Candidatus Nitrohelix vancouverensis]